MNLGEKYFYLISKVDMISKKDCNEWINLLIYVVIKNEMFFKFLSVTSILFGDNTIDREEGDSEVYFTTSYSVSLSSINLIFGQLFYVIF